MKTTMMFRPIANPRRTTLAHLSDEDIPQPQPATEPAAKTLSDPLPGRTANPRRITVIDAPTD